MATDLEIKLLDLLKETYAHFTRDSLPLAREIIDIETQIHGNKKEGEKKSPISFRPQKVETPSPASTPATSPASTNNDDDDLPF